MPTNTYSDGFPLTPLESIEFSYFLSEGEKQEWREWLQTATIEQQNELVDILHSMWLDNQKQVVPNAFNNPPTPEPAQNQNTYPPVDNFNQQPQAPDTSFTNETVPAQPLPPAPVTQAPASQTSTLPDTGFANENSFNGSQFQFVNESESTPAPQPTPQPLPPSPIAVEVEPEPKPQVKEDNLASYTNVEPVAQNEQPQFEQNFQGPNLSQPQVEAVVRSTQPARAIQPPIPPAPEPLEIDENEDLTLDHPEMEPITQSDEDSQEFALKKMANAKYKPNPILEDKTPPREEFVYKNGSNQANQKSNDNREQTPRQDKRDQPREQRDNQNRDTRDSNRDSRDNQNQNNNNQQQRQPRENRDNQNQQPRNDLADNQNRDTRDSNRDSRDNQNPNQQRENKPKQPPIIEERKKTFFSGSQLRQSAAKNLLDDVYKAYQDTRSKSTQTSKDVDDKFQALLERIMQVISNSEQLADYYETIIEKIIEVNDKVVDQAKEIQMLKNNTQSRGGVSLQDQVDEMRDDIERLNRDTRSTRIEQRRKYDELSAQVASFDADSFKEDKMDHVIDRLKSDIIQIQQKLNISGQDRIQLDTTKSRQENQNQQPRQQQNSNQPRKPQPAPQPKPVISDNFEEAEL